MDFHKVILIIAAAAAVFCSCKDDDEGEAKPYLSGSLTIDALPEFVNPGYVFSLTASGLEHPEEGVIGYSWKMSPGMDSYDTTDVFSRRLSDTLRTYTIYCTAFADGYSSSSTYTYTTVVKGGKDGSITGVDYPEDMVDNKYFYGTIGENTWTLNNIFEGVDGLGFRSSEAMVEVFGRYYNYEDAVAACESISGGWTLPTKEDWEKLEDYVKANPTLGKSPAAALMGDSLFNGETMWEYWPAVGDITNGTGFGAISAGYANLASASFKGAYEYAVFWTATSVEDDDTMAYYKYLICNEPEVFTGKADKESFGASVRCIRK